MFLEEKERKPIPMRVKRQVYERAKGKCEKCGIRLKMNEGDFHHTRDPTVTPRAKTVRFLCPLCHRRYGHKRKTRRTETLFGTETEVKVVPKEVVRIKKPSKKKPKTKRVAIRHPFWGHVIGYRTVKVRKPKTTKKKTTTRKTRKKSTSSRKVKTKPKRTKKKKVTKTRKKRR